MRPFDPSDARADMVTHQLMSRGIRDRSVLDAMRAVPREQFVADGLQRSAYADRPLPIAADQTISQPFIVALMTEALELHPEDHVLEIGTGSGYGAAVLSRCCGHVWTVERHAVLAETARERLSALGYDNVTVVHGDGTMGWAADGPYQAISVTAASGRVPPPLLEQLAADGRLVMPVGDLGFGQELVRVRRTADGFETEDLGPVRFVPLVAGTPPSDRA